MKGSENLDFLLNETYLYLLQNPRARLNASQLGVALGKNRKTIANQLTELKEKGLIDEYGDVRTEDGWVLHDASAESVIIEGEAYIEAEQ